MVHASYEPLECSYWKAGSPGDTGIHGGTVGDVLRAAAARAPERTALVSSDRWWTYRDLLAEATDGARALLASFIPGDVVAVWAENCPQWVALEFAAGLAGLTLVPVNPSARADEVTSVLARSGARGIFIGTDRAYSPRDAIIRSVSDCLPALRFVISLAEWDALRAIGSLEEADGSLPDVDPGGPARILYTGGTAGRTSAVALTHRELTGNAGLAAEAFGGRDGEVVVNPLPLSHVTGGGLATLGIARLAGTHVLMPRFDAPSQLALVERHRGEALCADPAMLRALLAEVPARPLDLGSLRAIIVSGGAALPAGLALEAETAFGVPVLTGLFHAESGRVIAATSPADALADRLGGVGRPLPGAEVKVTDLHTGEILPCGAVGEILVRGCQAMRGGPGDPRPAAGMPDGDGWLRTGDLGAMDSRGYCRVVGKLGKLTLRAALAAPGKVRKVVPGTRLADATEADLPDPRVPPQAPRSKALEDIDF